MRIDRMLSRFWISGLLLTVLLSGCGKQYKTKINQMDHLSYVTTSTETQIQVYDLRMPEQTSQFQRQSEIHTPFQLGQITLDKSVTDKGYEVSVSDLNRYRDWTPFRAELQDQAMALGGDALLINRVDAYPIYLGRSGGGVEISSPGNSLVGRIDEQQSEVRVNAIQSTLIRVKIEATVFRWTD